MKPIALFDLDGTITRADTMLEFLYFAQGRTRTWLLLATLLPLWCRARLGWASGDAPKEALVRHVFTGQPIGLWEERAQRFTRQRLPQLLRPGALDRIAELRHEGLHVAIVTASCGLWVRPWCQQHGLDCIATELDREGACFSGRLAMPNCKGDEKVRRILAHWENTAVAYIHAYGDTPGDKPMLALAAHAHYKPFRQAPH